MKLNVIILWAHVAASLSLNIKANRVENRDSKYWARNLFEMCSYTHMNFQSNRALFLFHSFLVLLFYNIWWNCSFDQKEIISFMKTWKIFFYWFLLPIIEWLMINGYTSRLFIFLSNTCRHTKSGIMLIMIITHSYFSYNDYTCKDM